MLLVIFENWLGKEAAVYSLLHEKTKTKGTFKIEPSSTLMLVKQFLPKIQQENARMLQEIESSLVNKSKFDIENVEDANKPVIEMVPQFPCIDFLIFIY